MGSSTIKRRKISKTGLLASDIEAFKKKGLQLSTESENIEAAAPQEVTETRVGPNPAKPFSEFGTRDQLDSLLSLFTKRQSAIKSRKASPGRKQVL